MGRAAVAAEWVGVGHQAAGLAGVVGALSQLDGSLHSVEGGLHFCFRTEI